MKLDLKNEELDAITAQLQQVVATGNVLGYLENNINYDIDTDLAPSGDLFTKKNKIKPQNKYILKFASSNLPFY